MSRIRSQICAALAGAALLPIASPAAALSWQATNLVTDDNAVHAAPVTDPGLINAWGLSYAPTGPFWVSSNGTGTTTLYRVDPVTQAPSKLGLVVTIPPAGGPVTGQVFNGNAAAFNGDNFLFVGEDGTVSGWRGALGTTAETLSSGGGGSVYKGAAYATLGGDSYLYAANFKAASIDVSKGAAASPNLTGSFLDPNLPAGFAPFNIQNLGGTLYVTYAQQDSAGHDENPGPGLGFVDSFNLQGQLLGRVASGGTLNAPWGLAIAPSSFGALSGALLVGNFGDGRISAYDPGTHAFLGQLTGPGGGPLSIDGLWALAVGNGGSAGSASSIYFTAGPNGESHGLFGVLTAVPEPAVALQWLAGLMLLVLARRRVAAPSSSVC